MPGRLRAHGARRSRADLVQPAPAADLGHSRRAPYRGPVPARRHIVQPQPHTAVRRMPAAGAARRVQALRARVHDADLPRQRRVHDRPRGQPLHDCFSRLQFLLARRPHGRPHAAAGRRPVDDRRRLPPSLAPDHAPRLPLRGDPRGARDDGSRDRPRARRMGGRRPDRPLLRDPATRATDRDAGAVRARPRRCRRPHRRRPELRAGARLLVTRLLPAGAPGPAHPVRADAGGEARAWTR